MLGLESARHIYFILKQMPWHDGGSLDDHDDKDDDDQVHVKISVLFGNFSNAIIYIVLEGLQLDSRMQ